MTDIILKLGGLQALILGALLIRKEIRALPNMILATLVFCFGVSLLLHSLGDLQFYLQFPHLIRVNWGVPLLFGPLLYLYTLSLTDPQRKFQEQDLWHFTPYLINLVIILPFFIKNGEHKILILDYFTATIDAGTDGYFFYHYILQITAGVMGLIYARDSLKVHGAFKESLKNEYSSIDKIKLDWLRQLLLSFQILSILFVIALMLTIGERYPSTNYDTYYYIAVFFFIYGLSYKALGRPEIIGIPKTPAPHPTNKSSEKVEDAKGQAIQEYMTESKAYLNGALTATDLAQSMGMTRHELSTALNDHIGKNFYDFINAYRVQEFKQRLEQPENAHLTLLAIAYDSGFNSKTSFNTIFKKIEGVTPSQYHKSQQAP